MVKVQIQSIIENRNVESVIQFGSSLKNKKFNDIDLCVFTSKKFSLQKKLKLQRSLPELYDVCFYDDLPIHIKKAVLDGKILYTKNY